jgi:hypothetical protein
MHRVLHAHRQRYRIEPMTELLVPVGDQGQATEEEAYLTIQRQGRQRRLPKREIAEAILRADERRRGISGG